MICPHRFLGPAIDRLGTELVSTESRQSILNFAERLPDVSSGHIFECRLTGVGQCDYSLVLTRRDAQFSAFQAGLPEGPDWHVMRRVFGQLGAAFAGASLIWLEFDATAAGPLSPPSMFLAPSDETANDVAALARSISTVCSLCPAPDLNWFESHLPDRVTVKQIGVMLGRRERQLRLVCDGIAPDEMRAFLGIAGWSGSMSDAAALIALAEDLVGDQPCRVDIDLGDGIGPTLGIEMPFHLIQDIDAAAARLVDADLCSVGAGYAFCNAADRRDIERDAGTSTRIDFGLNHLKLGLPDATGTPVAKAYFSLMTLPDFRAPMPTADAGI